MKKMGMGLFVLFIFSDAAWSQNSQQTKELIKLSGQSLAALAMGDVKALREMLGEEAIVGVPCSGKMLVAKTDSESFQEIISTLRPASQYVSDDFKNERDRLGVYESDGHWPFKKGDMIVINRTCTWGLVFRPQLDGHHQLKGFFLDVDRIKEVISKSEKKQPTKPQKQKEKKKKNKRRQDPLELRVFFNENPY